MTNRNYLKSRNRIPPAFIRLLQRFYTVPLTKARIRVTRVWAYGRSWSAITRNYTIDLDTVFWARMDTNLFLQVLTHELFHLEEHYRQGWLSHTREWLVTIFRSRVEQHKPYSHDLAGVDEEDEADVKRHEVYMALQSTREQWEWLLDKGVEL